MSIHSVVRRAVAGLLLALCAVGVQAAESSSSGVDENPKGTPEMLVKGARSSNTDIRRTEDDVQPYVVFDTEDIELSMAPDLQTFLKTRLPMNQVTTSESQNLSGIRSTSTVDLRGLGEDQTLILVNGRRMPGISSGSDFSQPDINGIPLSAVERIEVLPSTAGGIYGGGATGGVLNIILKRDYSDMELTVRYDGTFAGGGAQRRVDAVGGFALEEGRSTVMLMASYQDANPLYVGDRDFAARARALQDDNDRGAFTAQDDPIHGYTTNIRSVSGNELILREGMRSLGWATAHVPLGYAGPSLDGGAVFAGTAGRYNVDLADDLIGNRLSLIAAPTVRSLAVNIRREFTERLELFVDASRYDNRSLRLGSGPNADTLITLPEGPNNPFTEAVQLSIPFPNYDVTRLPTRSESRTEQISGGFIVRLPRAWTLHGEYSWSESTFAYSHPTALLTADGRASLTDGRLDPLSDVNAYPLELSAYYPQAAWERAIVESEYPTQLQNTTLRVAGPLLQLPGGALRLAAVLENREQYTGDQVQTGYGAGSTEPTYTYHAEIGAATESVYTELTAPLVSADNGRAGLRELDLQASYRRDEIKTRTRPLGEGTLIVPSADGPFPDVPFQTNKVTGNQYTLGFRYVPATDVTLRLSYGEGILPPRPIQLSEVSYPAFFVSFLGLTDPKRGGTFVSGATVESFTLLGSLQLLPEQSQSWSGGIILTPQSVPGLRLSVDYTRIDKTDEVTALANQSYLDLEDSFPGYVVRNPLTPQDEALGYTGGTIRELNTGNVNIAHSLVEAYDFQVDYAWDTRLGEFAAHAIATCQTSLRQQATPGAQEFDKVGYGDGPLKWRLNAGLRWNLGALSVGWNMQYYDASRVYASTASASSRAASILGQGAETIPTQSYHDVFARYRFGALSGFGRGLLDNAELLISVQNVLDDSPPIIASASSYFFGGYSPLGDARLRRYSIAFTTRFGL